MLDGLMEEGYVEEKGPILRLTGKGLAYFGGRGESL
jgi:hypothetical protein